MENIFNLLQGFVLFWFPDWEAKYFSLKSNSKKKKKKVIAPHGI